MKTGLPSLNALRAFEAAGRHGRMTLAAEELNVTHGAVSRLVRQLEEALGVALFEGPRNALRLTQAGRTLLAGLVPAFDRIERSVRQVADAETGPLDVSCLGTFIMRWLIPRLHRFQAAHPGVEVRLTAAHAPVDFSRDGCDVAVRVGPGAWPGDAEVAPLFAERFGPVLASRLLPDSRQALWKLPRLHTRTRPGAWADWSAQAGIVVPEGPGTEFEHFYFMLEAAMAGLGVCIAPWPLVADDVRSGRLAAPLDFIPSGLTYAALRRRLRQGRSRLFCDWLLREARAFEEAVPRPQAAPLGG